MSKGNSTKFGSDSTKNTFKRGKCYFAFKKITFILQKKTFKENLSQNFKYDI